MFRQWFDAESSTYTYLLADSDTGRALLIDPVLGQVDRDTKLVREMGLTLAWVLDTHVHADHITAAAQLRAQTGCRIAYPAACQSEGADRLLAHGDVFTLDGLSLQVRHTPGHTQGSTCYVDHANQRVFTGDTLLIRGCGRTDFQGGSSAALFDSVHEQLFTLDDATLVYPAHDYRGRTCSTIGEERQHNPRLGCGRTKQQFAAIMEGLGLSYPRLIDVAVPANRRLGAVEPPWNRLEREGTGALQAPISWVMRHAGAVRLIDVREPDEYDGPLGHVPGAELVPLGTLDTEARDWDRHQPIVTICRSGKRSDQAALTLESMGFTHVASMPGGTLGWNEANASCG